MSYSRGYRQANGYWKSGEKGYGPWGEAPSVPSVPNLLSGLQHYFTLEDGTANGLVDKIGATATLAEFGIPPGGVTYGVAGGPVGNGVVVSSTELEAGLIATTGINLPVPGSYTLLAVVKANGVAGLGDYLRVKFKDALNFGWLEVIITNNGSGQVQAYAIAEELSYPYATLNLSENVNYTILAWYDHDLHEVGIQANSGTPETKPYTWQLSDNGTKLTLSAQGAGTSLFVDEVGLWNRRLTAEEAALLFAGTPFSSF